MKTYVINFVKNDGKIYTNFCNARNILYAVIKFKIKYKYKIIQIALQYKYAKTIIQNGQTEQ